MQDSLSCAVENGDRCRGLESEKAHGSKFASTQLGQKLQQSSIISASHQVEAEDCLRRERLARVGVADAAELLWPTACRVDMGGVEIKGHVCALLLVDPVLEETPPSSCELCLGGRSPRMSDAGGGWLEDVDRSGIEM